MKRNLTILFLILTISARADFLANNFWPNAAFENGTNLDLADGSGTPSGWIRSGSDPTICQVTTNNSVSPTHSLIVTDNDASNYGEWDFDLELAGLANPGDALNLRYYQMYSVAGGEMRVTVLFFDAADNLLVQNHFTVTGDSPGWTGTMETSTFTRTSHSLAVPAKAVRIQVAVVSGGSTATTGFLAIDDLSIARTPIPRLLTGNLWPNSTFESGTNLNQPGGIPTGWTSGGTATSECQVATNNYVSSGHALMVSDADTNSFGEWTADLSLTGLFGAGDLMDLQWFELYSITNGPMHVSASFYDAGGQLLVLNAFFASEQSPGWQGAVTGSGFTQRNESLTVPPGAVRLRISIGSDVKTTGVLLIDDLSVARPAQPIILAGNFWPNPRFESGGSLDNTNGTPFGWSCVGDVSICQVTTNTYASPTHALALIDGNTNSSGQWEAEVLLSTNASPLDILDLQYYEVHSITNGQMRLSALFFDANSNLVGQTDFALAGQSAAWKGGLTGSALEFQTQQVLVPNGAVRLTIVVASGGPDGTTGVLVVDDLSVAKRSMPASVLAGNFFPNPTFEDGSQLDNASSALPAGGWQLGGNNPGIDQVSTNNSVSPTHSLALIDNDPNGYGEWYTFVNLAGLVAGQDAVDLQWFQIYSVTNGNMRLSFAFLDDQGDVLSSQDFTTAGTQSSGWGGSLANSSFEAQFQRLEVPVGASQLRVNFASGGSVGVMGVMLIDDLSVRLSKPIITGGIIDSTGFTLTWNSMSSRTYTVLYSNTLGPAAAWTKLATGVASAGLTTSYLDSAFSGQAGFYRVVQE